MLLLFSGCDHNALKVTGVDFLAMATKCRKIMEVTPGTLDVKSGPMRCWKGLQLQLMCCAPFRLLSQNFRMKRTEYQRSEDQRGDQSCSQSRT